MINFDVNRKIKKLFDKTPTDIWCFGDGFLYERMFNIYSGISPERDIGHQYEIVILNLKWVGLGNCIISDIDQFKAYLIEPPFYIANLIDNKYYGIVMKCGDKTNIFMNTFIDYYKTNHNKQIFAHAFPYCIREFYKKD